MCGSPAVPSTSARPSERKSIWLVVLRPYLRPGSRNSDPLPELSAAAPSSELRLKSNFASTSTVIRTVPLISSTALTICTQVVPFMPPTTT